MDLLAEAPDWYADAACRGRTTRLWFPERGETTEVAVKVCTSCPVQVECLEYALENGIHHGMWGGSSERARRRMRRARAA